MPTMLVQILLFLLQTVTGFLTVMFLLRFTMQATRTGFNNQLGQLAMKLSNWAILPLRKIVPPIMGFDTASVLAGYCLQVILITGGIALQGGLGIFRPTSLLLLILAHSFVSLLRCWVYLFMGLLIVQAVLSWTNPYAPIAHPVAQMTEPFVRPIRKILPPIANIDFSPLVAIIIAQILLIVLG